MARVRFFKKVPIAVADAAALVMATLVAGDRSAHTKSWGIYTNV
jgi:hypothetical protein